MRLMWKTLNVSFKHVFSMCLLPLWDGSWKNPRLESLQVYVHPLPLLTLWPLSCRPSPITSSVPLLVHDGSAAREENTHTNSYWISTFTFIIVFRAWNSQDKRIYFFHKMSVHVFCVCGWWLIRVQTEQKCFSFVKPEQRSFPKDL